MMENLDDVDLGIIRALQEDARISDVEIGRRVGLKGNAAGIRRKKLEQSGVIEKYTVRINERILEYGDFWYVLIGLEVNNISCETEIESFAKSEEDILFCDGVTGEFDYVMYIGTTTKKRIDHFTKRIRQFSFVKKVISLNRSEVTKTYFINPSRITAR